MSSHLHRRSHADRYSRLVPDSVPNPALTPALNPVLKPITSACLLALATLAAPAGAQESTATADADGLVQVVVTGTRASLQQSLTLKRNSAVVQDSISATELGRFPDNNVADSLSHITGVSISRTAGGEGQRVSIRGLGPDYTITTFNGRLLGTDSAGRYFAYDVLPADVISGADVVKSTQAQLIEGAIGGLVNLRSASPFEQKGQRGLLRVEADRNQMSDLNGRKLSGTYSNTFGDKVGVLLGVVYAKRDVRTDTAGNDGGWSRNAVPSDPSQFWEFGNTWGGAIDPNGNGVLDADEEGLVGPGQFRFGSIMEKKERLALSGKVEWRPTRDLKVVVDGFKTRLDSPQVGYQLSFYPLYAPGRWSSMQVANGVVNDLTLSSDDPELRLNPEVLNKTEFRVVDTTMVGANADWKISPTFKVTGDLYESTSKRDSGGKDTYVVLRMNQPNVTRIRLTGAAVPDVTTTFADGRDLQSALAQGQINASDFNTHFYSRTGDNIDDNIRGANANAEWKVDRFHVERLKFGLGQTNRKKSRDMINNAFNAGQDHYSGANAINVGTLGGNVINQTLSPSGFLSGVSGNFPRSFLGFDVDNYAQALKAYDGKARPGGGVYSSTVSAPAWNPLESYRVSEKTTAAFVQADLAGENWSADVGVRLVRTKTTAQAWDAKIIDIVENGSFNYTAVYADPSAVRQEASYTFGLPSFNFTYSITDNLQLRLGAAKTMARPSVDKLAPSSTTASISWGDFTQIFGGNAELKPYSARQADISLEWYYAKDSALTFAVYQKNIRNQITNEWLTGQDIGAPGGRLFNVQRPINGDSAKARGMEIGLQHLFDNGFGVRAQYTRNLSSSWVNGVERPLEGIAPATASFGVLYERGPWSMSTTADYTDSFVTATNVLGAGWNETAKSMTWLTAQLAYEVNKSLRISIEGNNLTDAEQAPRLGNGTVSLPNGYYRYGRSITLGASLKF
ncbi:TonB-dependent receptor [Pseudoduganella albidiflava]|uniref:TonB-dependent receptor n=1 Tax=Pseudoduganella albidiflava TaxID=321983 RepID=A0A411WVJ3_9BURK|nr:TonB-dependent receptor [Pseudoduganella albidiflava]QBI00776.1 TonB-dependent receptor [Pseudoduganella albidiflava]GGY30819.1 TonB-dependent receptor [Pseudoduganella albidiflava]